MKDIVEDYTDVFESNICDPDCSWEKCFSNFCDIIALLRGGDKYSDKQVAKFLLWASQLLEMKRTINSPIGTSLVNWRKEYSRKNIWREQ